MLRYIRLLLYYIKKILYQRDWLTPKTTSDKIDYIIAKEISLYDSIYRSKYVAFITSDVIEYKEELRYINTFDIYSKYITVKRISPDILKSITLNNWCSDNGRLIPEERLAFIEWLEEAKNLLLTYKIASASVNLNILYSNSMKIRPYEININDIVGEIYSILKK